MTARRPFRTPAPTATAAGSAALVAVAALATTLAAGCVSRGYNAEGGAGTEALRPAREGEELSIIALKDTTFKALAAGTRSAASLPASQKCLVRQGTRLRVQRTAAPGASNHYRVTFADPVPAVATVPASARNWSERQATDAGATLRLQGGSSAEASTAAGASAPRFENPLTFRLARAPEREAFSLAADDDAGADGGAGGPALSLAPAAAADAFANTAGACPFSDGFVYEPDWDGNVLPPSTPADDMVRRFVDAFRACGQTPGTYYQLGGGSCGGALDCSSSIQQAYRRIGVRMAGTQADSDPNFTRCTGGVKPGDHLLLAKPGREPDHWVTLVKVNDPAVGNSRANVIVDVSSDCNGLCPVQPVRSNLAPGRRGVYACARLKALDTAWKSAGR